MRRITLLFVVLCALGCLVLGGTSPVEADDEDLAALKDRARAGDSTAQVLLGMKYEQGDGIAQDYAKAVALFRKAAEQGDPGGAAYLGVMYEHGRGVVQDHAEAVKWYREAAEQGMATGQTNLGAMFDRGLGTRQDHTEAVKWYRNAAEQGHAGGQKALGTMYARGRGVQRSDSEAVKWYRKAAAQGHGDAQLLLGYHYTHGLGVTRDRIEAYFWLSLAAIHADDRTKRAKYAAERDRHASALSAAQLAEIDRRVRAWKPKKARKKKPDEPTPAAKGKVLSVIGSLCIISLGAKDGVRKGDQFVVLRGGKYFATIQADDVQAKQSACSVLKDISKSEIRRGDTVGPRGSKPTPPTPPRRPAKPRLLWSREFPKEGIKKGWKEDLLVQDVESAKGVWRVTMIPAPRKGMRQAWFAGSSRKEVFAKKKRYKTEDGWQVTEFIRTGSQYLMVVTTGSSLRDQFFIFDDDFPSDTVDNWYAKGLLITCVDHGSGEWIVVMSRVPGWGDQQWHMDEDTLGLWRDMAPLRRRGFAVTEMAQAGNETLLVLTTDTGMRTGDFLMSPSLGVLAERLAGYVKSGKSIVQTVNWGDVWLYVTSSGVSRGAFPGK